MSAAWYPAATRRAGPAWKTSGDRSETRGAVYHSVEGSLASAFAVLDGPREASWPLTNPKVGKMLQHYPLGKLCWHARGGNDWSLGVENEGRAGQPLTESQVQNLADFSAWLVEEGWLPALARGESGLKTLWEHNEVGAQASPPYVTACPSGRIPWAEIIRRAEEEDEMALILARKDGDDKVYVTDWLWKRHVTRAERNAFLALDVPFLNPVPAFMEELLDNVQETARLDPAWTGALAAHGADPDAHHE